jgi:uncharacterized protein (DUF1697 family)
VGQRRMKMADLLSLCRKLELELPATYLQSGNVVFSSSITNAQELEKQLSEAITKRFGFEVPVLVRNAQEWSALKVSNPYVAGPGIDLSFLHVTFLSAAPDPQLILKAQAFPAGPDSFRSLGREIYLHTPGGYGNTKLSNAFFESKLKLTATTRNWKTVGELEKMAQQQG